MGEHPSWEGRPPTGGNAFSFECHYSGEGKVEKRGQLYRCAAALTLIAVVGDVRSETAALYVRATGGDELQLVVDSLAGMGRLAGGTYSGDIMKIRQGAVDTLKGVKESPGKDPIAGTQAVTAALKGGTTYDLCVLASGAVTARASAGGNGVEAESG